MRWFDEDMPVDDFGNKAEVIISPETPVNRINFGQWYEQFISAVMYKVLSEMKKLDTLSAYKLMLEFLTDVNPVYGELLAHLFTTEQRINDIVKTTYKNNMMYIITPPFLSNLTPSWILDMCKKYKLELSPVTYKLRDNEGNVKRVVRTLDNVLIGSKYQFTLCKVPTIKSCAVAHVTQHGLPAKLKAGANKSSAPISKVPIRLGEDEIRYLMMTVGPDMAARIINLYSNSLHGVTVAIDSILNSPDSFNIQHIDISTDELINTSNSIKIARHFFNTVGIDSANVKASEEEIAFSTSLEERIKNVT